MGNEHTEEEHELQDISDGGGDGSDNITVIFTRTQDFSIKAEDLQKWTS